MHQRLKAFLSLLLVIAVLSGCGGSPATVDQQTGPAPADGPATVTLKIGQLPVIDGLAYWVAEQQGYYQEQGVDVQLITFKSALERDAALSGGEIDGTMTDIIGAVTVHQAGRPVKIASLALGATREESPFAIVAAPGSGITSVEQLKGVEIGISNITVIHYVTEKLLLEHGFAPEEIKLTNITQIPVRFEALMSGQIQAATLPEPLLSLAVSKGARVILSDTEAQQNYSHSVTVFTDEAIAAKADAIRRFFVAYNQGVEAIKQDPMAYRELLAERANLPPEIRETYQVTPYSPAQAPEKADVEAVIQWLSEKGVIQDELTYEEIVDPSLLPEN
jgi:NitT/TauT family transport system substrate-binding protein